VSLPLFAFVRWFKRRLPVMGGRSLSGWRRADGEWTR
jgi:hypothetical protein